MSEDPNFKYIKDGNILYNEDGLEAKVEKEAEDLVAAIKQTDDNNDEARALLNSLVRAFQNGPLHSRNRSQVDKATNVSTEKLKGGAVPTVQWQSQTQAIGTSRNPTTTKEKQKLQGEPSSTLERTFLEDEASSRADSRTGTRYTEQHTDRIEHQPVVPKDDIREKVPRSDGRSMKTYSYEKKDGKWGKSVGVKTEKKVREGNEFSVRVKAKANAKYKLVDGKLCLAAKRDKDGNIYIPGGNLSLGTAGFGGKASLQLSRGKDSLKVLKTSAEVRASGVNVRAMNASVAKVKHDSPLELKASADARGVDVNVANANATAIRTGTSVEASARVCGAQLNAGNVSITGIDDRTKVGASVKVGARADFGNVHISGLGRKEIVAEADITAGISAGNVAIGIARTTGARATTQFSIGNVNLTIGPPTLSFAPGLDIGIPFLSGGGGGGDGGGGDGGDGAGGGGGGGGDDGGGASSGCMDNGGSNTDSIGGGWSGTVGCSGGHNGNAGVGDGSDFGNGYNGGDCAYNFGGGGNGVNGIDDVGDFEDESIKREKGNARYGRRRHDFYGSDNSGDNGEMFGKGTPPSRSQYTPSRPGNGLFGEGIEETGDTMGGPRNRNVKGYVLENRSLDAEGIPSGDDVVIVLEDAGPEDIAELTQSLTNGSFRGEGVIGNSDHMSSEGSRYTGSDKSSSSGRKHGTFGGSDNQPRPSANGNYGRYNCIGGDGIRHRYPENDIHNTDGTGRDSNKTENGGHLGSGNGYDSLRHSTHRRSTGNYTPRNRNSDKFSSLTTSTTTRPGVLNGTHSRETGLSGASNRTFRGDWETLRKDPNKSLTSVSNRNKTGPSFDTRPDSNHTNRRQRLEEKKYDTEFGLEKSQRNSGESGVRTKPGGKRRDAEEKTAPKPSQIRTKSAYNRRLRSLVDQEMGTQKSGTENKNPRPQGGKSSGADDLNKSYNWRDTDKVRGDILTEYKGEVPGTGGWGPARGGNTYGVANAANFGLGEEEIERPKRREKVKAKKPFGEKKNIHTIFTLGDSDGKEIIYLKDNVACFKED